MVKFSLNSVLLPPKTLDWLLEDNNPPVRNLTKFFLLNEPLSEKELEETNNYKPIKEIISLIKPNGSWSDQKNPYKKYTGDYWQVIFLCDMNAKPDELILKACRNIISYQLPNGGFTHKLGSKFPLICLTANIIRSLIHFDIKDKSINQGIDFLTDNILKNKGTFCSPDPLYTLLPDCQMTLTKVLAMYAILRKNMMSSETKRAVNIIEEKLVENKIFKYIPKGSKEYQKQIRGKKSGEIRKIRKEFLSNPSNYTKQEPKKSWLKFGFPHSYTSDILETLYWIAKSEIPYHKEFDEAIEHVINTMNPSGYWINQLAFRNPMLVQIEEKKSPSKWLTFRASYVLKYFQMVEFQD